MVTARLAHVIWYVTPGIEEQHGKRRTTKIVSGEEHGGQCPWR
jgi:hypothetical protein